MFKSAWFDEMLELAGYLETVFPAPNAIPVGNDERVVGFVPPGLRPLIWLELHLKSLYDKTIIGHTRLHNSEEKALDCERLMLELAPLVKQIKTVSNLFWTSIHAELNWLNKYGMGLREGYKLVTWDAPKHDENEPEHKLTLYIRF